MTLLIRTALIAMLAVSSIPSVAEGQATPADSLLRRISVLERRATDLERRVRELEELIRTESSRSPPVAASSQSSDLQNWRRLRLNMTIDQVRALLGEPERVTAGEPWIFWYYPGSGNVRFNSRTSKVDAWTEPRRSGLDDIQGL